MINDELVDILKDASAVPLCPTEKFVDNFHAHMRSTPANDHASVGVGWAVGGFGTIAAVVLVASGLMFWNNLPLIGKSSIVVSQNVLTKTQSGVADDGYQNTTYVGTSTNAADQFASQLVGYEDISTVVSVNGM